MESDIAGKAREVAEAYFASGLYCAESVVLALAQAQGVSSELLPRAATAFCGGMSRTCGTCGALTGAVMGLGLAFGRSEASASPQPAYRATQRLVSEFEQEFGSRECHVLLGCDLGTAEGQEAFRLRNLSAQCRRYTGRAAEIAARLLAEQPPGGA